MSSPNRSLTLEILYFYKFVFKINYINNQHSGAAMMV